MARTGFLHHIGTFLLLVATILLIVTCISAPVVNNISLMKVDLGNLFPRSDHAQISYGTFGYCTLHDSTGDECTKSRLGYSPARPLEQINSEGFDSHDATVATRKLTKAMILHPIACGINFIAFMLSLGAGMVGSLLASMVALLAFLVTAVIMIIDFVLFNIVRKHVNDRSTGVKAHYGNAAWTILAATICSLLGSIILLFTCCSGRRHKHRGAVGSKTEYGEPVVPVRTRRRRRFGIF